ncbi:MAG: restriction endonuclease subunit S [Terriglobia bacterium]
MKEVWPIIPLGQALEISADRILPSTQPGARFNYVGLEHIESHTGRILTRDLTLGSEIKSTKNVFRPGQVLYGKLRPYLNKVHLASREGICSTDIFVVKPNPEKVNAAFTAYYLRSPYVLSRVNDLMQGANLPRLSPGAFLNIPIPLPPLPEQHRIVNLLDEADELRRRREQADRRTADLIPALFYEMFGDPANKKHPFASLSDVAEVVSGIAKGRRFNGQRTVTVPYIRVANVQAGFLELSEIKTIEALPAEVKDLTLKRGDVLLTEGGDFDKLGRGALWETEIPDCIHQNHIFRVRVNDSKLIPVFFMNYLQNSFARTYFLQCSKRTTNLASINMSQLRALPVPLPPVALQRQFAARVAEIRALQARQAESRRRLDDLFQSMLHRAFQGEL